MRIALVTESFMPDVNGVAHSVVRTAEHLIRTGHEPIVIAPVPAPGPVPATLPYPVVRIPSVPMPGYPQIRLGLPMPALRAAIRDHRAEVVHLASPFVLGAWARTAASSLGLPTVAVYQTDVAAYARARNLGVCEDLSWRWIRRLHNAATRTLAPSTESMTALRTHGVERVHLWRRGVDDVRFHPGRRSAGVRRALCRDGEVLVGFVGRLAVEKEVDLLAGVSRLPHVRLVVIGDGPAEAHLRRALPEATFLGARHGGQLARIYASLDVFAHTGPFETFGQTVQEAMASGIPVVAPAKGGPRDLVHHDHTGLLVPAHEETGFTDAVARLAADPSLRRAMGAAGRAAIAGRSWSAVGDQLLHHYAEVLGRPLARQEVARPRAAAA
ncbi:glycosyl transferase family 1 [Actinoplanes sp. SE50]|uniref:glycosyltransferase family 4 protein n=1 Tax=unclassified Actinoplanes TaxID=2626549 RepID=UPI00023ECB80|nr:MULTISPECIES: glycosyltransferase family 1 protein [unclassified Actinoplanes]AEV86012.1 phosphatidylinositol alpha 1, 6-mannosyltransferase [Actinoplanes sp. SE50/110]ATO84410.1 glycosyl transferase family 1 [Actinoplanes sp. SE50]SLM01820.1 glycosyl transferase family 1 [Actinoplanes sp. SE50/110]